MNLKTNFNEANRIELEKKVKEAGGNTMRTYAQKKQAVLEAKRKGGQIPAVANKPVNKSMVTFRDEYEYSHWREEFIWETDKKYPDKVKEIKPMTGKNTITINPEDETSKYKRGY